MEEPQGYLIISFVEHQCSGDDSDWVAIRGYSCWEITECENCTGSGIVMKSTKVFQAESDNMDSKSNASDNVFPVGTELTAPARTSYSKISDMSASFCSSATHAVRKVGSIVTSCSKLVKLGHASDIFRGRNRHEMLDSLWKIFPSTGASDVRKRNAQNLSYMQRLGSQSSRQQPYSQLYPIYISRCRRTIINNNRLATCWNDGKDDPS